MEVKYYGREDDDPSLLKAVLAYAESQGCTKLTVAMHQRAAINARPCAPPGGLTYDFAIDARPPQAARQYHDGRIACPL